MSKKICVITGTRAEFGLLRWLIQEIDDDPDLSLLLLVTGMHLSPEFGQTFREIEKEGIKIDRKIEILMSSDTPVGISKSIGLGTISFAETFEQLSPDIIVVLGDRYEILSAVIAAMISRIPVAHIHGGETTEGAFDESIRHSITKMSHLHFTATEEYRNRVIQLGEQPDRVFNVGTPGLDNLDKLKLLSKKEFEKSIGFNLSKHNLLVTYHPVTLEDNTSEKSFNELLSALSLLKDTHFIFTKPNADTDGRVIIHLIDEFVKYNPNKACSFQSLGHLRYLSALQYVDCVVGNSSSGLIEAPSFKVPTVNIGDRQKGRIKGPSVIDCEPNKNEIYKALLKSLSSEFRSSLNDIKNPYGESGASKMIKDILKSIDSTLLLKKSFYDM